MSANQPLLRFRALVMIALGMMISETPVNAGDPLPSSSRLVLSESETWGDDTSPTLSDNSSLSDLLVYAALNNPGLEAAFYNWKAALQRAPQVSALPDPRFTYKYFIREVETRVGPQKQSARLSQTFPWFGKLALKGNVAEEAARSKQALYEARKLALFHEVRSVYYEFYYLNRSIEIIQETRNLVKHLEDVARSRYKSATANQAEVIRAQVELGKLEDRLRGLIDRRGPLTARLNAALNRPMDANLPSPKSIPEQHLDATNDQVLAWARDNNPNLWALRYEIEKTRQAILLTRKDYFPDITLGLDYTSVGSPPVSSPAGFRNPAAVRSASRLASGMGDAIDLYALGRSFSPGSRPDDAGQDIWVVSLSMNIPIRFDKYSAGEREAKARHRAARATHINRTNALTAKVQQVLYDFRDALRKIDLYRDALVPKANQNLRATEAAYRAGEASFLDLVDAERSLLEFQLSYEFALSAHAQKLSELDTLIGRDLPRKMPSDSPPNLDKPVSTIPEGNKP